MVLLHHLEWAMHSRKTILNEVSFSPDSLLVVVVAAQHYHYVLASCCGHLRYDVINAAAYPPILVMGRTRPQWLCLMIVCCAMWTAR